MTTQPASTVNFSVWESRWQALNASIESYKTGLDGDPGTCIGTLKSTLENLQTFAEKQFHFFCDGFYNHYNETSDTYSLVPSDKYPPEYVLGVILKQVAYDLEVIQRAAEQRLWESPEIENTLNRGDKLARQALSPPVYKDTENEDSIFQGDRPTVITYFEKSPSVRFFPYDKVALIAIPFTCVHSSDDITTQNARDYAPLLHELGHYIFWYGEVVDGNGQNTFVHKFLHEVETLKSLKDSAIWCYRWLEEIFADVSGCTMGGSVITLSAQELALVASEKEFTEDDREHPVPAIRPTIYTDSLRKLEVNNNLPEVEYLRVELEKRWGTQQGEFTVIEEQGAQDSWQFVIKRINFAYAREKITEVTNTIIEQVFKDDPGTIYLGFWGDRNHPSNPDNLEQSSYESFQNLIEVLDQTLTLQYESRQTTWEDWVSTNDFLEGGPPVVGIRRSIDSGEGEGETRGWLYVLDAGGWATKITISNPSVK